MKYLIVIGCWMVELMLLATIMVSLGYRFAQALMLATMFLPVLLAMKFFLPQIKIERRLNIIIGVGCLFLSFLVMVYLLLMLCHSWMMSYEDQMPSVLLNPVFLVLILTILFVVDTAIGKQLDKHCDKAPSSITFISERKNVTLLTEQILYVESNDTETWVHTLDGERYRNKTSISQWEQILEDGFLRIHRSFLVNTQQISQVNNDCIMLGEISIPISRKYKEVVAAKFATTTI